MTDPRALIAGIASLAETVLPLIVPGSKPMIEAGHKLVDLINATRETFPEDNHDTLDMTQEDIEERISAKVDDTVAKLRGAP